MFSLLIVNMRIYTRPMNENYKNKMMQIAVLFSLVNRHTRNHVLWHVIKLFCKNKTYKVKEFVDNKLLLCVQVLRRSATEKGTCICFHVFLCRYTFL